MFDKTETDPKGKIIRAIIVSIKLFPLFWQTNREDKLATPLSFFFSNDDREIKDRDVCLAPIIQMLFEHINIGSILYDDNPYNCPLRDNQVKSEFIHKFIKLLEPFEELVEIAREKLGQTKRELNKCQYWMSLIESKNLYEELTRHSSSLTNGIVYDRLAIFREKVTDIYNILKKKRVYIAKPHKKQKYASGLAHLNDVQVAINKIFDIHDTPEFKELVTLASTAKNEVNKLKEDGLDHSNIAENYYLQILSKAKLRELDYLTKFNFVLWKFFELVQLIIESSANEAYVMDRVLYMGGKSYSEIYESYSRKLEQL